MWAGPEPAHLFGTNDPDAAYVNVQVKNVVTTSLEKILMERDVEGAKQYVKSTISDLLMNRLDLSLLVVTKVGSMQRRQPQCADAAAGLGTRCWLQATNAIVLCCLLSLKFAVVPPAGIIGHC